MTATEVSDQLLKFAEEKGEAGSTAQGDGVTPEDDTADTATAELRKLSDLVSGSQKDYKRAIELGEQLLKEEKLNDAGKKILKFAYTNKAQELMDHGDYARSALALKRANELDFSQDGFSQLLMPLRDWAKNHKTVDSKFALSASEKLYPELCKEALKQIRTYVIAQKANITDEKVAKTLLACLDEIEKPSTAKKDPKKGPDKKGKPDKPSQPGKPAPAAGAAQHNPPPAPKPAAQRQPNGNGSGNPGPHNKAGAAKPPTEKADPIGRARQKLEAKLQERRAREKAEADKRKNNATAKP